MNTIIPKIDYISKTKSRTKKNIGVKHHYQINPDLLFTSLNHYILSCLLQIYSLKSFYISMSIVYPVDFQSHERFIISCPGWQIYIPVKQFINIKSYRVYQIDFYPCKAKYNGCILSWLSSKFTFLERNVQIFYFIMYTKPQF